MSDAYIRQVCKYAVPREHDAFQDAMQHYRLPTLVSNTKGRRNFLRTLANEHLDEVIDTRHLQRNSQANCLRLREHSTVLEREPRQLSPRQRVVSIKDLDGVYILPEALSAERQAQWIIRCLKDYSRLPHTNLSNLGLDNSNLWHNAKLSSSLNYFRKLRWCNLGCNYDWTARHYIDEERRVGLPLEIMELANEAAMMCGYDDGFMVAEGGIMNLYPVGAKMKGHVDDAEQDEKRPIISVSLGCSCIYLQGGSSRRAKPTAIYLRSGDVLVMGGISRRSFHGVARIIPDTFSSDTIKALESGDLTKGINDSKLALQYISSARINLNVRQIYSSEETPFK